MIISRHNPFDWILYDSVRKIPRKYLDQIREEDGSITAYYNLTADKTIGTQLIVSLLPNENKTITPDLKCLGGYSMQKLKVSKSRLKSWVSQFIDG